MTLTFTEKGHRYRLDGKPVESVTTLIKGGLPAPALVNWAARTVAEYVADNAEQIAYLRRMGRDSMVGALKGVPWSQRDRGAATGTEIHALGEQIVAGKSVEVPARLEGYVQGYLDFLDDWQIEPLVVERPVAHRAHWWAGRVDLFARYRATHVGLFDLKTSASGIWPETAFQLSAYRHAEFYVDDAGVEQPVPDVDLCAAVWLRPDGYDVIPVRADDDVYLEFRHIARVALAAKRSKDERYVGDPMSPPGADDDARRDDVA